MYDNFLFYDLQIILGVLLTFVVPIILWTTSWKSPKLPPQIPGSWPIIGHLRGFGEDKNVPLARTFGKLSDQYGPIFTIKLGMFRYCVINNWEAAKDCFAIHDKELAARPISLAAEHYGYNYARFSFANYGPYYCQVRKLVLQNVLSYTRLEKIKHVRISEVENSINELYNECPKVINMSQWFEKLTLNIIVKMISGKRYESLDKDEEAQCFRRAFAKIMYLAGQFILYDAIPFQIFKYVDFQGHIKTMKQIYKDLDDILQSWVNEHMKKDKKVNGGDDEEEEDCIDAMLSVTKPEDFKPYGYTRDTVIKATVLSMILDGSDTTAVHLTWLMSLLLNNPHVMKHAQEEIDNKVGTERWVEESDIKDLVYLQAIVKEALRLYPPAPLLVPHEAVKDCNVAGYYIPKGTRLFPNAWKIQRDPRVYSDPDKFMPERFLNEHSNVDARGQHFEFIPFGSGRRSCPGINFATLVAHLTISRLIQGFTFDTPSNLPVDMIEGLGITMPKANPVEVVITPRLNSVLYEL
uniref:Tropinone synthase n=1 Tax=Hyoscyamus niger TaxID=4079 RepID=A0AA51WEW4_HYONI|nr:tropinone synthase [Hyoscyamus niger]